MTRRDGIAGGQIALLVAATWAGGGIAAQAATPLYWPGNDYGYDRPVYTEPDQPRRRIARQQRMPKAAAAKAEKLAQGSGKPTGPVVVAVSIERQTLRVFDANGFFAESPISSGMKGHSTPMGVFSVIQKNKYHRSNIYSGAPMPYMQRITWSGIAMHAGALPGYPASHGCIRLPMAFAVKMWGWTRMGARVVITPGEISPANFAHPLLASLKATPMTPAIPMASAAPAQPGVKALDAHPVAHTKTADASNSMAGATVSDVPASVLPVTEPKPAEPATVIGDTPVMAEATIATEKPVIVETPATAEKPIQAETPPTVAMPALADKPIAVEKTPDKPATAEAVPVPLAKGTGPIAIFVSRKDAKLYVRQNFAPMFDVPVTISGDQPLGTHVFTAFTGKDASKPVQWTALTLPASTRSEEPVLSHRRQAAGAVVTTPPAIQSSAHEALDRLNLTEDVLARLGDQLSAGSSLVISDQGITASGETGKGTDFIIRLR